MDTFMKTCMIKVVGREAWICVVPARSWVNIDQDVEHAVITLIPPRETLVDGVAYLAGALTTMTKRDRRVFEDGADKVTQQQESLNKIFYDGSVKSMTCGPGVAVYFCAPST